MNVLAGVLFVLGSFLAMLAGLGILRFPDTFSRLQAAAKLQATGMAFVLVGAALVADDGGTVAVLALIGLAMLVTVPALSQALARAAHRAREEDGKSKHRQRRADR